MRIAINSRSSLFPSSPFFFCFIRNQESQGKLQLIIPDRCSLSDLLENNDNREV